MKKALLLFATFITAICIIDFYWWLKTAFEFDSFEETLNVYLSIFPKGLQDGRLLANLRLAVLLVSLAALIYLVSKQYKLFISIVVLIPTSIMFMWTLFSLM